MDKYIDRILEVARTFGTVATIEMSEASIYCPKRIEVHGTTEDGERFTIDVAFGEKKNDRN